VENKVLGNEYGANIAEKHKNQEANAQ